MLKVNLTAQNIFDVLLIRKNSHLKIKSICDLIDNQSQSLYVLFKTDPLTIFPKITNSIFIVNHDIKIPKFIDINNLVVRVSNSRFALAMILEFVEKKSLFIKEVTKSFVSKKARVDSTTNINGNVHIEDNVKIGPHCQIGDNVYIGFGTQLMSGAKIVRNTKIGNNCIIRENSVIGGFGFGIVKDNHDNNYRIPYLGGVVIGNFVEIGSLNTVCSGTIKPTVLKDYVKTDDHVHIAHNDSVEKNSIITAGVIISGNVIVEKNVWLGANASIIQGRTINENSLVGIGAVVTKDIPEQTVVAGNPARSIEDFKKINNYLKDKAL
jgi:UDP-3-O-[3-hydroxymyristoyl] glucosamine N-acyltransferase LpxD